MGARNLKEKNKAIVADPGIPRGGDAYPEKVHHSYIWQAKNCMKMKGNFGPRGRGVFL